MKQDDENWDDASVPEYTEMQKYAFVTKRALENDYVGYCYREFSDIKIDSGWRFLFGNEDDDYLDNPENTETKDLSEIAAWKPELQSILSAKKNSEFEWNEQLNNFVEL